MDDFRRIAILGLGLMGGSMALALKGAGYRGKIVGFDLCQETIKKGLGIGAIDMGASSPEEAVQEADLVIMAVPIGSYQELFQRISPYLDKSTVVTDLGSVKGHVVRLAEVYLPKEIQFIGGHPMAGSEKGGLMAATGTLFENAYYFLTPTPNTTSQVMEQIKGLIQGIGAYPIPVDPLEHDKIAASISHIPHLTAVLLVYLLQTDSHLAYLPFVGGGFRDTTRIASGNPEMWKDIFFYNKEEMIQGIEKLESSLERFKGYLKEEARVEMLQTLREVKAVRDGIPYGLPDYIPPLFDLIIDIEDRPGSLGELTGLLGDNNINIKEIEILHAREEEKGAIRVGFKTAADEKKALELLKRGSFPSIYRRGVGENVKD